MNILKLELCTKNLHEQTLFYNQVLGFEILEQNHRSVSFQEKLRQYEIQYKKEKLRLL